MQRQRAPVEKLRLTHSCEYSEFSHPLCWKRFVHNLCGWQRYVNRFLKHFSKAKLQIELLVSPKEVMPPKDMSVNEALVEVGWLWSFGFCHTITWLSDCFWHLMWCLVRIPNVRLLEVRGSAFCKMLPLIRLNIPNLRLRKGAQGRALTPVGCCHAHSRAPVSQGTLVSYIPVYLTFQRKIIFIFIFQDLGE